MITAFTNLDLYRYDIHALLKAFYPETDVKVFIAGETVRHPNRGVRHPELSEEERMKDTADKEEHLRIRSVFSADNLSVSIVDAEGAETTGNVTAQEAGANLAEKSTAAKTALKHLLYDMLKDRTGRELPWGELIGVRPTKISRTRLDAGDTVAEACAYMEKQHLVSHEKALLAAEIADREKRILSSLHGKDGYSLYLGIPFCPSTCLYCSFPSYPIGLYKGRTGEYLASLIKEIRGTAEIMKDSGKILDTVYFGGGTPTSLSAEELHVLLSALEENFDLSSLREFTVEAGRPDSINRDKMKTLKAHGVDRISVNPQTMNDKTLQLIGRRHSAEDVRRAFALAREEGFDNINMDLILGLPGEGEAEVTATIAAIEELRPDDLTVHSLALKRGSRMQEWIAKNGYEEINNTDATMKIAAEGAARLNLLPYYLYRQKNMSGNFENVGYAREGAYGIYNILIMEEVQSIVALGAGSISKRVFEDGHIERSENVSEIETYLGSVEEMLDRKRKLFGK